MEGQYHMLALVGSCPSQTTYTSKTRSKRPQSLKSRCEIETHILIPIFLRRTTKPALNPHPNTPNIVHRTYCNIPFRPNSPRPSQAEPSRT